jgi:hypothetical protein
MLNFEENAVQFCVNPIRPLLGRSYLVPPMVPLTFQARAAALGRRSQLCSFMAKTFGMLLTQIATGMGLERGMYVLFDYARMTTF